MFSHGMKAGKAPLLTLLSSPMYSPLMRMPSRAATPVATMTAVGVASPKAQGQAMTSTSMAFMSPRSRGEEWAGISPRGPRMAYLCPGV